MKPQKHTVMFADDSEDECFLLETVFGGLGTNYRVVCVRSGDEAIEYLSGKGKYHDRSKFEFPAYMITDLNMAPGDGFTVLEFLQQNRALSVIPVVMLSSSTDEDDIQQAYRLGVSSYFAKPESLAALKDLLRNIHDYWARCEVPQVDAEGHAIATSSCGKLGARFRTSEPPVARPRVSY